MGKALPQRKSKTERKSRNLPPESFEDFKLLIIAKVLNDDAINLMDEIDVDFFNSMFSGDLSKFKSEQLANKAQVYLLAGVNQRWKTTLGYDLTGGTFSAEALKIRIFDLIKEARKCGINVTGVVMDMGGTNQKL